MSELNRSRKKSAIFLVTLAVGVLLCVFYGKSFFRSLHALVRYTQAPAQITLAEIQEFKNKFNRTRWTMFLTYRYEVGARTIIGNNRPDGIYLGSERARNDATIRYSAGNVISIRYNSGAPGISIADTESLFPMYAAGFGTGVVIALLSLFMLLRRAVTGGDSEGAHEPKREGAK